MKVCYKKRVKTKSEEQTEQTEYIAVLNEKRKTDKTSSTLLEKYWLSDDVDENEKFLRNFVLNKGWINKTTDTHPDYNEITEEIDKIDQEHLRNQAVFERKYNFRFEEPDANIIPTFSRHQPDSLRKPDTKLKDKCERLKERKAREKKQLSDEKIRKLKEKKAQIFERLKSLKEIIGEDNAELNALNLDEEWDSDLWDQKMQKLFNENSTTALSDNALSKMSEYNDEREESDEQDDEQDDGQNDPDSYNSFSQFQKRKVPDLKKNNSLLNKWLDEYYALDYEDMKSGIPCRFKYVEVKNDNFGLSTEEILNLDDKELNQRSSFSKAKQVYGGEYHTDRYLKTKNKYKLKNPHTKNPQTTNPQTKRSLAILLS